MLFPTNNSSTCVNITADSELICTEYPVFRGKKSVLNSSDSKLILSETAVFRKKKAGQLWNGPDQCW